MRLATFRKGGIHPPQHKITAASPITDIPAPQSVCLPLSQHIGAPAVPVVNKGDTVARGQLIAKASGAFSSNIHAPISGTVSAIGSVSDPTGYNIDAITITASDSERDGTQSEDIRPRLNTNTLSAEEIIHIIGDAGIVGLGGATFPTQIKLTPPAGTKVDILIINGAECEPYLTCDHALMLNYPREIADGIRLLMKATGVSKAVIGIESNKPDAIKAMQAHVTYGISVMPLKTKYPQGGEKQLIKAITGREVPSGALPASVGAIVQNVATAYAVWEAVVLGKPLIDRVVTVTGEGIPVPGNYRVPFGMAITRLLEIAGITTLSDRTKVIAGGPMMGRAISCLTAPVTKGTSGLLILETDRTGFPRPQPCIRCGACIEACPMGLEPYLISTLSRLRRFDEARSHHIMDCIECGSCSYSCPATRPLVEYIRLGKSSLKNMQKSSR